MTDPQAPGDAVASRTVFDPFLQKNVDVSDKLTDRLIGKYASGPTMANGEPEFGWRQFETPPIQHEAAVRIIALETERDLLQSELTALSSSHRDLGKRLAEQGEELERERAKVAALKLLVRGAYSEGFTEGTREHTTTRGGKGWQESATFAALQRSAS